ncbi:MAG: uroporphyrinogen decarboxylase family protein [Propionivibrio sp.]
MSKRERVECAMRGDKPDRVPVSIYQHSTAHDRGVEPFVDYTLRFHARFDPDYVKVMYDELYDVPVNFQFATDSSVWDLLEDLDPHRAGFGRYLESLKRIRAAVAADTPVIATVFTPFHIAVRLAWRRLLGDCRNDGARVERGLATITRNTVALVKAAIAEAGVDGFFLGGYGCEPAWLAGDDYRRIAAPGDREVVAAMRTAPSSPYIIAHAHGGASAFIDLCASYDCDALSWEDRQGDWSLGDVRERTPKCLLGGVDHVAIRDGGAALARTQALDAIRATGGRGHILAPGCTFLDGTPAETMLALKAAAEEAAQE